MGDGTGSAIEPIEFGPLPEGWTVASVGDVVVKTTQIDPASNPQRQIKYVDVSSVSSDRLRIEGYADHMGEDAPSRARKVVKTGDVIFATVRPYLRRIAVVPLELDGEICSTAFCVLRAKPGVVDPGFLFFATSYDSFVKRVAENQRGAAYPAVRDKDVLAGVIPLPPLPEQQAIACVLRTIQRAKEATEKVIAACRRLKQSLMRHLFTYGPVPFDQADKVELKETEDGEVPQSWEVKRLGDIATLSTGTTPSTNRPDYYTGPIPFVKTAEIANTIIRQSAITISRQAVEDYHLRLYPPGAVFMAMYGQGKTRGQVGLLAIDAATTQNTAAIVPAEEINSEFLWLYLMSMYEVLREKGFHGQISHLNLGYVRDIGVPVPPLREQRAIVASLMATQEKLEAEQSRLTALTALFNTLLHNLMTGKVRVV